MQTLLIIIEPLVAPLTPVWDIVEKYKLFAGKVSFIDGAFKKVATVFEDVF
jgi:hypothetical protein